MSASLKFRFGVVAAGLSCLVVGYASAQQTTQDARQEQSSQARDTAADRAGTDQTDRAQPGQPYTAQFRGTQATAGGQDKQVQQFLAACLLAKNKGEIELAQFAQQQAQNPEVKEFAQQMVQDHQQIVQKLQPLAGTSATAGRTSTSTSLGASSQIDADRQDSDTPRLPGSSGAGQATATGTNASDSGAINKLIQLDRQIADRHTQAVRELLQDKQGAEFDKCYLGSQIGAHMHMVAALEVIEQQGPDELRQLAQQAQPKIQQHLDHAKQLLKQLESSGSSSSQAERQSSRTQR